MGTVRRDLSGGSDGVGAPFMAGALLFYLGWLAGVRNAMEEGR